LRRSRLAGRWIPFARRLTTILSIDSGEPIVILAGVHVGCFELFATERVRTISDLKGKDAPDPARARGLNR
jgi:hypothetical protein